MQRSEDRLSRELRGTSLWVRCHGTLGTGAPTPSISLSRVCASSRDSNSLGVGRRSNSLPSAHAFVGSPRSSAGAPWVPRVTVGGRGNHKLLTRPPGVGANVGQRPTGTEVLVGVWEKRQSATNGDWNSGFLSPRDDQACGTKTDVSGVETLKDFSKDCFRHSERPSVR